LIGVFSLNFGTGLFTLPSTSKGEAKMKYMAAFLLMLSIGSCAQAQKLPEYEPVNLTILKIEHIREDREGILWYIFKLTMRDSQGIIYRAHSDCITSNPDSPWACSHLTLPRIGKTASAILYPGVGLIYFSKDPAGNVSFEIDSEEVSGRAEGK
jgi:hypothetical protein